MSPVTVEFDVTAALPLEGRHHVSTWVFPPVQQVDPVPLLFCLPGGSYTKAYWHLDVPGQTGYSFAEHMAAKGMLVVAVDHLGTGASSRHPRAVELSPPVVAGANAAVLSEVLRRAEEGTLVPDGGPLRLGPRVGVGHSMGAMLTIFQQSLHGGFDAIAPLGYGTVAPIIRRDDRRSLPTLESVVAAAQAGQLDNPPLFDRRTRRDHFYWNDVPPEVVAADDLTLTTMPGMCGMMSIVPFIALDHAGRLRCPVFIGLGEEDATTDPRREPCAYSSSSDITFFVLGKSGHCHNSASTRHQLWDRLARWVRALEHVSLGPAVQREVFVDGSERRAAATAAD